MFFVVTVSDRVTGTVVDSESDRLAGKENLNLARRLRRSLDALCATCEHWPELRSVRFAQCCVMG